MPDREISLHEHITKTLWFCIQNFAGRSKIGLALGINYQTFFSQLFQWFLHILLSHGVCPSCPDSFFTNYTW